jgi:hypothetical protein
MSTLEHRRRVERPEVESQDLKEATQLVLEECRMVLPGVQALFGFQLIAVFNDRFSDLLSHHEQQAHLIALTMSALAVALLMAPAAYHRQAHPKSVSKEHLRASSWMLTLGMLPLMLAIHIDVYLVARIVSSSVMTASAIVSLLAIAFVALWIVFPRYKRYQRRGSVI